MDCGEECAGRKKYKKKNLVDMGGSGRDVQGQGTGRAGGGLDLGHIDGRATRSLRRSSLSLADFISLIAHSLTLSLSLSTDVARIVVRIALDFPLSRDARAFVRRVGPTCTFTGRERAGESEARAAAAIRAFFGEVEKRELSPFAICCLPPAYCNR